VINAKVLAHPLIPANESVPNDVQMGGGPQVLIITGANMAGKSTFLRTIGINLILALNGSPVCAKEFSCPIIHLRTGMRTADSLKDHQSYFYAELDRLKGIMDELRRDVPLLILLDEILKGTNSTDKQAGSIALVKQLLPHPCLAIIATHDLALGDLEKTYPEQIRNFCFEANIENDQLSFDYKLKPGLAQKMNATFLMKKMGIIPS
jgi:DNA mismatch repair ATPase MutS